MYPPLEARGVAGERGFNGQVERGLSHGAPAAPGLSDAHAPRIALQALSAAGECLLAGCAS